ncbi:MAG: helix-turn-helix transcriptional regulator [Phycisphaerales bacterium]|nr:helix-turn-helix transcriptional regulator [Phycisphaerales bacterium]
MRAADFVKIAKALADPTRLRMLEGIRAAGKQTCSDVCSCFKLSQPTISHHIKMLEASGVVHAKKSGAFHVLSVNEPLLRDFARHAAGEARKSAAPRSSPTATQKKPNNHRHSRSKSE